ncbi:MAG: hypothetical protein IPO49_00310 [Bacteroidetes bacterium]|nr:hypothetical protein [Bacteroidota bacterium]
MSKDFTKILEDAEKQVAGIKNEKLREIAFSKLVSHLLDGNSSDNDEGEESSARKPKAKAEKRSSPKSSKGKTDGPKAWIEELQEEKFFSKPKSSADIREELETRSHHLSATDITRPLETLCHEKKLRRKKVAPENGGKAVLHWVNW